MRVIAGTLKGRRIPAPPGRSVRPTSDRTKEAIFSILTSRMDLQGIRVLDLYAGSGNLGFESLSRGAGSVLFVERDPAVVKGIQSTAAALDVLPRCRFRTQDVNGWLQGCAETFDLIFADPPYDEPTLPELPDLVLREGGPLALEGCLVVEHDKRLTFGEHEKCVLSRPYGRTIVSLFVR